MQALKLRIYYGLVLHCPIKYSMDKGDWMSVLLVFDVKIEVYHRIYSVT